MHCNPINSRNTQSRVVRESEICLDYHMYQVALSSDLGITSEALADAHLSEATGVQFLDPMLATLLLSVVPNLISKAFMILSMKSSGGCRTRKASRHRCAHISCGTEKHYVLH